MQPISNYKEPESLLQTNRANLRKVFFRHYPKDNKISPKEFLLFAKNVSLYPDLLSLMDIKQFLKPYKTLSFRDFEDLLGEIAYNSFNSDIPTPEKIRLFLVHTRNSFKMHYFVNMAESRHKSSSPVVSDNSIISENEKRTFDLTPNSPYRRGYSRPVKEKLSLISPRQKKNISPFSQTFKNLVARNRMLVSNKYERDCTQTEPGLNEKKESPLEISRAFGKFKESHSNIVNCIVRNEKLMAKQTVYIECLKKRLFSSEFVKRLCFAEWRRYISNRKRHRTNPYLFEEMETEIRIGNEKKKNHCCDLCKSPMKKRKFTYKSRYTNPLTGKPEFNPIPPSVENLANHPAEFSFWKKGTKSEYEEWFNELEIRRPPNIERNFIVAIWVGIFMLGYEVCNERKWIRMVSDKIVSVDIFPSFGELIRSEVDWMERRPSRTEHVFVYGSHWSFCEVRKDERTGSGWEISQVPENIRTTHIKSLPIAIYLRANI